MSPLKGFPITKKNVQTVLKHPSLINPLLKGQESKVVAEHVLIETKKIRKIDFEFNGDKNHILQWAVNTTKAYCHNHAYMYPLMQTFKPEVMVETGVCAGISSSYILSAIAKNVKGKLYSIDLPNVTYEAPNKKDGVYQDIIPQNVTSGYAVPDDLRKHWRLMLGDSKKLLPKLLQELGEIDVFFHDSAHTYDFMMFEFETAWPHIREGGVLLSDDVDWNDALKDFSKKKGVSYQMCDGKGLIFKP
jgi:hypothetical protein